MLSDRDSDPMKSTAYMDTSVVSYLTARPSRDVVTAAYQQFPWCLEVPMSSALTVLAEGLS